jgi:general stress protein YciG
MSANRQGGLKIAKKLKARNPDHYRIIGALGGKASRKCGFYVNRELASRMGRIGGQISRRGPAKSSVLK